METKDPKDEIDFSGLIKNINHNLRLLQNLLNAMLKNLQENTPLLQQAAQEADHEQVRKVAHKIRSATCNIQFHSLNEVLTELESAEKLQLSSEQIKEKTRLFTTFAPSLENAILSKLDELEF